MASAAQIEANRQKRKTGAPGPRLRTGNCVHAGMHSSRPEGPHPDPRLDPRRSPATATTLRLIDELQPSNQAELDQVCQAARLTLAVKRAERLEMAHMNQRIRDAAHVKPHPGSQPPAARGHSRAGPQAALHRRGRGGQGPQAAALGRARAGCWSPGSRPAPRAAAGCWRGGPSSASCWTATPVIAGTRRPCSAASACKANRSPSRSTTRH